MSQCPSEQGPTCAQVDALARAIVVRAQALAEADWTGQDGREARHAAAVRLMEQLETFLMWTGPAGPHVTQGGGVPPPQRPDAGDGPYATFGWGPFSGG